MYIIGMHIKSNFQLPTFQFFFIILLNTYYYTTLFNSVHAYIQYVPFTMTKKSDLLKCWHLVRKTDMETAYPGHSGPGAE